MPTVTVRTASSSPARKPTHPRLTLATAKLRLELPFAPVEGPLTGLGDRWEEVDRQGLRAPLLVRKGPQLAKLALDANIVNTRRPDDSVELYLYVLALMARGGDPVHVTNYGSLVGNAWRITGYDVAPYRRQPGTNAITGANVSLELTVASDLRIVIARNRPAVAGSTPSSPTSTAAYKFVTVQPGETATTLAIRYYGTAGAVPFLLELNDLRDPRQITAGKVIKVPNR